MHQRSPAAATRTATQLSSLGDRLFDTRALSMELAAPLGAEDMVVQAMDDASPTKWHLAHVTWFFETFVLEKFLPGYRVFDDRFNFCFNSYYESQGERHPRARRGLLTRPTVEEVFAYRKHVDDGLARLVGLNGELQGDLARLVEIGINHEQQHQELLLTDILALFAANPLRPAYRQRGPRSVAPPAAVQPLRWVDHPGGVRKIGHDGHGFAWDNEAPRHDALVHPFRLADRLVTNGEWLEFIEDGGYGAAMLWLADGWATVNRERWQAPLYWENHDGQWLCMTLEGLAPPDLAAPVAHVSYFEADAFARWSGKRLPTEFEWEVAAAAVPVTGSDMGSPMLRPVPAGAASETSGLKQMFGAVWQWTQSAYLPYPGYRPPEGAIGEYNGKFMVSQQVLRGSSCATPPGHARPTYRNFFYPQQRWQFTGLRLASEIGS
jgi:ergothioneine biosynthesis protein EgtB